MRIDPSQLGVPWIASVTIRGTDIHLRSPLEVEADEHGSTRGGLLLAPLNIARGIAAKLFGVRALASLRKTCRELTTEAYWPIVNAMSGGELALMYHVYLGAQRSWYTGIAAAAARHVDGGRRASLHDTAEAPTAAPVSTGARQIRVPLIPGSARLTEDGTLRVPQSPVEERSTEG
jgi:hypothetical protein